jgi:hypothetical protein
MTVHGTSAKLPAVLLMSAFEGFRDHVGVGSADSL